MSATTRVLVLYTGGTIGMVPSDPNNPASPLYPAPKERLIQYIPNPLDGIAWEIEGLLDDTGAPVGPLDSSSVGPKHWEWMAQAIDRRYAEYDGFVILHGTDTMAFTGSALSFLLQNLAKPVIVTGSQLPIFKARTDAITNFTSALSIAGYKATGIPCVPEVAICFADVLLRGNRATKVSTSKWQGFDTPNYPHLGHIGEYIQIDTQAILTPPDQTQSPFFAHKKLNPAVMHFSLYPGMQPEQMESVLGLRDIKGYVFRTFGTGNAPEDEDFLKVLAEAVKDGNTIVNNTQCLEGKVEMGLYTASSGLQAAGLISGMDMTAEAALTKMMWLLATEVGEEVAIQMQINQRGEQSENLFDVRYPAQGRKGKPVEVVTMPGRPSGQFRKEHLTRAIVRLTDVCITGAKENDVVKLALFVNLPSADRKTDTNVAQFAGWLEGVYREDGKLILIRDITATVNRVVETGRPVNLTLVPPEGQSLWFSGAYLNLFTRA